MKETDDETVRDHFKMQMFEYNLNHCYIQSLLDYIMDGVRPAGFLKAVIINNFTEVMRFTTVETPLLDTWCRFMHWEMPVTSWGNRKRLSDWCRTGGLRGIAKHRQKGILDVARELSSVGSNEVGDSVPREGTEVDEQF